MEYPHGCLPAALVELFATDNDLEELPAGMGHLKSLVKLQLSFNRLHSLPSEVRAFWICYMPLANAPYTILLPSNASTATPLQIQYMLYECTVLVSMLLYNAFKHSRPCKAT